MAVTPDARLRHAGCAPGGPSGLAPARRAGVEPQGARIVAGAEWAADRRQGRLGGVAEDDA
eukprot:365257-Chlamydomonas_euryale.AAC.2